MDRKSLRKFAWPVTLAAFWLVIYLAGRGTGMTRQVSYDAFETALAQGRIERVQATDTLLIGHLAKQEEGVTDLAAERVEPELAARLERFKVPYERIRGGTFLRDLVSWLMPTALLVGFWYFMMRRSGAGAGMGGLMGIGRSSAKVHVENDTGVTFDDVAGIDEAKAELEEVVQFLRHPQEFGRLGARIPRGVLLVGPPGTGKTMLAKAVAGQAQVPFFSISGSEFVEMFVGVGAARVRDLFAQARQRAPAIVFIDELDALGRARGLGAGWGGNDEKEQTLNQLLTEMDGFDTSAGVVMLAATNRPEILDPALLRAGRFDRQVLVDRPDRPGRTAILAAHARKVKLDPAIRLDDVAALTVGFSGADLANLVNEAALAATRRKADCVAREDFVAAIERIVAGLERRSRVLNPRERERVAWHEMGHALVAIAQRSTDLVRKVSIVPRGVGALGYTLRSPLEDRYLMSRSELEARLAVLMAGRAAEVLVFGDASTGAADDLARATDIATDMVGRQGMDAGLGNVSYERQGPNPFVLADGSTQPVNGVSDDTLRRIDEAVRRLLGQAFDDATRLLKIHRADLDRCARALLERETLDEAAIVALAPGLRTERAPAATITA
jgi:cell division protease FtsH